LRIQSSNSLLIIKNFILNDRRKVLYLYSISRTKRLLELAIDNGALDRT
jgi:hypothetical protein